MCEARLREWLLDGEDDSEPELVLEADSEGTPLAVTPEADSEAEPVLEAWPW